MAIELLAALTIKQITHLDRSKMSHQSPQSRRLTIIFELSNLKDKKRGNVLVKAIWKKLTQRILVSCIYNR